MLYVPCSPLHSVFYPNYNFVPSIPSNNEPNKDPGPELKFSGGEDSGIGTESGAATGGGSDPALNPVVDKVITVIIEFMPALHEFLTNPPPAAPIILNSGNTCIYVANIGFFDH
jgi:hypothetical protein